MNTDQAHGNKFGSLMIDLQGDYELTDTDHRHLNHPLVVGVILFRRNYKDRYQLADLIQQIRESKHPTPIIAVDHEGGRVQRFHHGFTRLPNMQSIGSMCEHDSSKAEQLAFKIGLLMAAELIDCGIDLSFAPVLDVLTCDSQVIGDRSFHRDPQIVSRLAGCLIDGMHSAGMSAVVKHFPGHGGTIEDSHTCLPRDNRRLSDLEKCDLLPFESLLGKYQAVMTAHVLYDAIDDQIPTYSAYWVKQKLRNEIGFNGVVFSDDLSMAGANDASIYQRFVRAKRAGCDIMLICNDQVAVTELLNQIEESTIKVNPDISTLYAQPKQIDPELLARARSAIAQLNQ